MPYIEPEYRPKLDPFIEGLARNISDDGELSYALSRLAIYHLGMDPRYADHNAVLGVMVGSLLEFYRTRTAPYEDGKRAVNGDVSPFLPASMHCRVCGATGDEIGPGCDAVPN